MTEKQKQAFAEYFKTLSMDELVELKNSVQEQIDDLYWCDENFWMRDCIDSFFYMVVYKDLHFHYDYIGKRAYEEYKKNDDAIRIEYKTKELFPSFGVLMSKGEL